MGCLGGTRRALQGMALVRVLSPQAPFCLPCSVPSHMTQLHPQHQRILTQQQQQGGQAQR